MAYQNERVKYEVELVRPDGTRITEAVYQPFLDSAVSEAANLLPRLHRFEIPIGEGTDLYELASQMCQKHVDEGVLYGIEGADFLGIIGTIRRIAG